LKQQQKQIMDELHSLLELLFILVITPRTGVLFALLIVAAVSDYRTYRIPNWLTFGGIAFGLLYSIAAPASWHTGFLWALQGLLVGFLIMLPLYALKAMGAGDVKLMAMAGTFLGAPDTFYAALCTFIVGGVAALGFALFNKAGARMLSNVRSIVQGMALSAMAGLRFGTHLEADKSVGRLPYGVSIGIGTISYVVAKQLGYL
jgi:prepilin peptidase CpaA